jgi:hypothetical protein
VTRGGGFGGLVRTTTADSAWLSPGDRQEMQALVRRAGLRDDRPAAEPGNPGPDRFTYTVTVEDQGQRHAATFPEQSLPAEVRDLISWVSRVDGHRDRVEPPGGIRPLSPAVSRPGAGPGDGGGPGVLLAVPAAGETGKPVNLAGQGHNTRIPGTAGWTLVFTLGPAARPDKATQGGPQVPPGR